MKIDIPSIIDKHKGKTAFIVANGPSTRKNIDFLKKISSNKQDKYVIFVCNEIDEMLENIDLNLIEHLNPDYWVIANTILTVKARHKNYNILKKNKGILIYADSVDITKNPDKLLDIDYLPYDQRHFKNSDCPVKDEHLPCCTHCQEVMPNRLTVQEELQKYTDNHRHYGTGSTVALHMLSFSILMGCKKIYLSGIDLNYRLGYFDNITTNYDSFDPYLKDILEDFSIIKESAEKIDTEIINLSEISVLKTIFRTNLP